MHSHKLGAWQIAPLAHVDVTLVTVALAADVVSDLVTFADVFVIECHREGMPIMSFHDKVDTAAAAAAAATLESEDSEITVDSNHVVVAAAAVEPGVLGAVGFCSCNPIRIIVDSVVLP